MATAKSTDVPLKSKALNRDKGSRGEEEALGYLKKRGYTVLELNYRCPFGEIDIIARDGKTLVFVEVKSRTSRHYGDPELSVDWKKQRKLSKTALHYLGKYNLHNREARFDVLAITRTAVGQEIRHIPDAFDLAFR